MSISSSEIAQQHLSAAQTMQLGTVNQEGRPRVNSVYFVASVDNKAVYWMSEPDRRHSIDILKNRYVAGAVAVKPSYPVMGVQFIGTASEVTDSDEVGHVVDMYNKKYKGQAAGFYERFQTRTNKHHLYKMTISSLELFDEMNFPESSPLEVPLD
jgi:uncharacterized protein YhbP (UPF0306 family)